MATLIMVLCVPVSDLTPIGFRSARDSSDALQPGTPHACIGSDGPGLKAGEGPWLPAQGRVLHAQRHGGIIPGGDLGGSSWLARAGAWDADLA
jgi:hypothetical protein